jgi:F-type H+-transporting ATPase subunit b
MEQLIEAFGIDVRLITIQIINFLILLGLLSYFLYKPVLKLLADREAKIAQGIQDAEAAAAAKHDAEAEKQRIVAAAHHDAEAVAARAKVHADATTAAAVTAAAEQAAGIIANAEAASVELKAKALKESEAEVAKVAILAAEKILRREA